MATANERPLSEKAQKLLEVLKEQGKPMTVQDFKEMGINANGSSFRALESRGLINVGKTEITVTKKRVVNSYEFIDQDNETDTETE